jgi:hypothetical protein
MTGNHVSIFNLSSAASEQTTRTKKVPQSLGKRLIRANQQMVDTTTFQFAVDLPLIRPLLSPVTDERSAGFRFLRAKDPTASQVIFRRILHLQHDAIVSLVQSP